MTDETLRLHLPEPTTRPGMDPDASMIKVPAAGTLPKPPLDEPDDQMWDYALGMVRVLGDDDLAVGDWDPKLDADTLRRGLTYMMRTRAFDDRMLRQQRQGKTSFYMKCTGEEACGVAQAMALRPDDMLFPSYRQQSMLVARDWPLVDLMCQIFNNPKDR
ncbi:MAG: 3-methyl-2-oxobutanoate dehydrogenase (2-methylpropanoyl-transferring) subunit alpha, partial [Abyssibacter sp.]